MMYWRPGPMRFAASRTLTWLWEHEVARRGVSLSEFKRMMQRTEIQLDTMPTAQLFHRSVLPSSFI